MLVIEYSEEGTSNADSKCEELARLIYKRSLSYRSDLDYTYTSSTESLFTAFRVLIVEGDINHDEVVFKFDGEIIELDKNAQFKNGYPIGFCDTERNLLFRLIKPKNGGNND